MFKKWWCWQPKGKITYNFLNKDLPDTVMRRHEVACNPHDLFCCSYARMSWQHARTNVLADAQTLVVAIKAF
jgi:hypothetical protein